MAGIDDYTVLMLHGDGSNGSTTFTDSSPWGRTMTAVGNAQISTAQSKFGGSSMAFDGTGDWLTVPASAQVTNFGTDDFTIDMWVRFNSVGASQCLCSTYYSTLGGFVLYYYQPNGNLYFENYTNSSNISIAVNGSWTPVINTWYHVAVTRSGTSFRLFINGTQIGSTVTDVDSITAASNNLEIGTYNTGTMSLNGYIDEFRISRKVARWTRNFTAPDKAYTQDPPQVPMAVFDGTNDYMRRGADLTGVSDGTTCTLAFWFTNNAGAGVYNYIFGGPDSSSVAVGIIDGQIHCILRNSAGTNLLVCYTTRTNLNDGNPHHFAMSVNVATSTVYVYVDGVNDLLAGATIVNGTIDFTRGNFYVGEHVSLYRYNGKLGQVLYRPGTHINLSTGIAKLYNAGPVCVGYDGSAPFAGTVPAIYLGNEYPSFQTNMGAGGNFTLTGALTEGGALGSAVVNLSYFDGTDYFTKAADLTGNADGKQGIFSCWFSAANNGVAQDILKSDNNCVEIYVTSGGEFIVIARDSSISTVLLARTGSFLVNDGNLHHVVASWNLATGYVQIYIDGVDRTAASPTVVNANIDYTRTTWAIGSNGAGSQPAVGNNGQLYFNVATSTDLSVQANREKFIKDGRPVYLGAKGEIPTGSQPILYLPGNYKAYGTNNTGSGGNFTLTGALDQSGIVTQRIITMGINTGTFTVTGQNANLLVGRKIVADPGSFSLGGQDVQLKRSYIMPVSPGAFTLAGQNSNLVRGYRLLADVGVFTPRQRTNLWRQSQTLGTTWIKTRSLVVDNAAVAPDGTMTAEKVTSDLTAASSHQISLAPVSPYYELGKTYTHSIYAKAGEYERIRITMPTAVFGGSSTTMSCYYNLVAGVLGTKGSAVTAGIEHVGDGWYRCWICATVGTITGGSGDRTVIWLVPTGTTTTFDGDGTSGVYLWGGQCEVSQPGQDAPTPYIPTTTVAVTSTTEYANFLYNRRLTASVGTFALTGQNANLVTGRKLIASTGSFALTGIDANLKRGYRLDAGTGSFLLTGQNATLKRTYIMHCDAGSFTFTGIDALLTFAMQINLDPAVIEATAKVLEVLTDVDIELRVSEVHVVAKKLRVDARPNTFTKVINSRSTEEVFIILVTIDHEGLEVPIRVSNDNLHVLSTGQRGVISNGDEYVYLPFNIVLPNLERDTLPSSKIVIDNIDRAITAALADITEPPEVRIQIALSSDPDIIDYDIQGFKLNTVTYDELQIEGTLSVEYFANEPFPAPRFTPSRFPGLFRGRGSSVGV